jgi:hypothetical protein
MTVSDIMGEPLDIHRLTGRRASAGPLAELMSLGALQRAGQPLFP